MVGGGDGDEGADVDVVFDGRTLVLVLLLLLLLLLCFVLWVLRLLFVLGSGKTSAVGARLANHVSRI